MDLHERLHRRYGASAPIVDVVDVPETVDQMLGHRSCRTFTDEAVDRDVVTLILAAALSSPSKSDLQQVTVIWLTDPGQRQRVLELSPANAWALGAAEAFVFCADSRRIRRAAERLGRDFPNNHLDQFMNASVDCGIALGAAVHAATAYGLGTCPISELRDEAASLTALLELPQFVVPVCGLALGRPVEPDRPVIPRLAFDVTVQQNTYSDATFDAEFDAYEQRRDELEQRPDEDQRDVAQFGVTRPYGWAEDRTRQYSIPRRADWGEHVRSQGYGLD
ncbi:MAG: nitroreductase family protein [Acidimicrobiales bacterium]